MANFPPLQAVAENYLYLEYSGDDEMTREAFAAEPATFRAIRLWDHDWCSLPALATRSETFSMIS